MTGEMWTITQEGVDNDGNEWPIHAAIVKALGGTLQPFDKYQGPYILIGEDVRLGQPPYAVATQHLGVVRLWVVPNEEEVPVGGYDTARIYREDTDTLSSPFQWEDTESAIACAREVMSTVELCTVCGNPLDDPQSPHGQEGYCLDCVKGQVFAE